MDFYVRFHLSINLWTKLNARCEMIEFNYEIIAAAMEIDRMSPSSTATCPLRDLRARSGSDYFHFHPLIKSVIGDKMRAEWEMRVFSDLFGSITYSPSLFVVAITRNGRWFPSASKMGRKSKVHIIHVYRLAAPHLSPHKLQMPYCLRLIAIDFGWLFLSRLVLRENLGQSPPQKKP